MKKVVILGPTGSGKSALSNILLGSYQFEESARIHSHTTRSVGKHGRWRGVGQDLCIIDTQGHGDSEGRDSEHIHQMVECLKQQEIVHTFILLFNGQNPRFDESLCSMLTTFIGIFGPQFLKHSILGFSNWGFDVAAERRRSELGISEYTRNVSFADHFKKQFGLDFDIPAFFYEREYGTGSCHNTEECARFEVQMNNLLSFINRSGPCDMRGINAILAEKDKLKQETEQLRQHLARLEAEMAMKVEMERQRTLEMNSRSQPVVSHPVVSHPPAPPARASVPPGVYYIYSKHDPKLVLDVASNNNVTQSPLIVFPFHGSFNQQFIFQCDGTIKAAHSGQVLELKSGTAGNRVVQNHHNGNSHQRWVYNQDGTIGLEGTNLVFDIEQASKTPRAKVIGWHKHGGSNQKWQLVKKY